MCFIWFQAQVVKERGEGEITGLELEECLHLSMYSSVFNCISNKNLKKLMNSPCKKKLMNYGKMFGVYTLSSHIITLFSVLDKKRICDII